MKKVIFLLAAILYISSLSLNAQNSPLQQMPVKDRIKHTVERMTTELSLRERQAKDLTPIYTTFYTDMCHHRMVRDRCERKADQAQK